MRGSLGLMCPELRCRILQMPDPLFEVLWPAPWGVYIFRKCIQQQNCPNYYNSIEFPRIALRGHNFIIRVCHMLSHTILNNDNGLRLYPQRWRSAWLKTFKEQQRSGTISTAPEALQHTLDAAFEERIAQIKAEREKTQHTISEVLRKLDIDPTDRNNIALPALSYFSSSK